MATKRFYKYDEIVPGKFYTRLSSPLSTTDDPIGFRTNLYYLKLNSKLDFIVIGKELTGDMFAERLDLTRANITNFDLRQSLQKSLWREITPERVYYTTLFSGIFKKDN